MKKVGLIIFAAALVSGVVLANAFSFGRSDFRVFDLKLKFGGVKGSGNVVTEKRGVSDFSKIVVGGVFNVEIVAGREYSVEVTADDNLLPYIETETHGDTLDIRLTKRVSRHSELKVKITAPVIDGVESGGASRIDVSGVTGDTFDLDTSGASRVTLRGDVNNAVIRASGAGSVDAGDLRAANADVDASGAAKVAVNVSGHLKADASGASRISYRGSPASVERHTSGAGSVDQR
ncbi:MAG: head GIN domain-containing protein [Pyrinomonadaceae bacterium]